MTENGFEGEYLGGHVDLKANQHVLMQLDNKKINVHPYPYPRGKKLDAPFLSISYEDVSSIQNVPSERISTLRVLALGIIPGLIWRKNEHCLTLTFKDELDMEQTIAFKMKKTQELHEEIYDRVVEAKKKKKLGK